MREHIRQQWPIPRGRAWISGHYGESPTVHLFGHEIAIGAGTSDDLSLWRVVGSGRPNTRYLLSMSYRYGYVGLVEISPRDVEYLPAVTLSYWDDDNERTVLDGTDLPNVFLQDPDDLYTGLGDYLPGGKRFFDYSDAHIVKLLSEYLPY